VRLSCTHTHSGPNTFRLATISDGLDMAISYLESLPLRVAGAVWQAQKCMREVRIGAGLGRCEFNVNRRFKTGDGRIIVGQNWDGPVDHSVRILRFDDLAQIPVGIILHYACHPTTMAWDCTSFTPDYPGAARETVESQMLAPCLFLQGAAGNVTPNEGFSGDVRVYRRLGKILGLEASKVATNLNTRPYRERFSRILESGASIAAYERIPIEPEENVLQIRSRTLKLPLRNFPDPKDLVQELQLLDEALLEARRTGNTEELRAATARATQANARANRARLYHGKSHIDWLMQGIRIGPAALLSIPGEPYTELNRRILEDSPFKVTMFSGYSNGGFGYLPTREAYTDGGYEVDASPFSPDAADIVVQEGIKMLKELA
jgi:hypothetical protein